MKNLNEEIGCSEFEERLSDYLEKDLESAASKLMAAHALKCPLCHSLLNDVKSSLEICQELPPPKASLTGLEARVLSATVPESQMPCQDFEKHLTDYLDGFLPAPIFHRWERHAVLCEDCTDLPGEVVRSIAACYTYKMDEFPLPEGLHDKILEKTLGTVDAETLRPSWVSQAKEWMRDVRFPISVPQLAPVAMMLLFAFLVFNQTASADRSIRGVYQKSFEMAGNTYRQGADIVLGGAKTKPAQPISDSQNPAEGTSNKEDR
ncbi:MAG: zf-HC2 domain-containing protein [Pyrinomonadaceae bacterium]|nr:zf-HC2 domain-containing protein [Pyrinomonadaceae bacterium]